MMNARSIRNKISDFRAIISDGKLDIVCVCESMMQPDMHDYEVSVANYLMYRSDRAGRGGGGIIIYVKNSLKVQVLPFSSNTEIEFYTLAISFKQFKTLFCMVYRPPQMPISVYTHAAQLLSSMIDHDIDHKIICGDFNFPKFGTNL